MIACIFKRVAIKHLNGRDEKFIFSYLKSKNNLFRVKNNFSFFSFLKQTVFLYLFIQEISGALKFGRLCLWVSSYFSDILYIMIVYPATFFLRLGQTWFYHICFEMHFTYSQICAEKFLLEVIFAFNIKMLIYLDAVVTFLRVNIEIDKHLILGSTISCEEWVAFLSSGHSLAPKK